MKTFLAMLETETKLMIRDMNSLIFGVGFSVIFTVILGMIMGDKPAFEGADYSFMEQSFGAIVSITIGATGLMGLPLVLADYRHKKILKKFWVTPISPSMLLIVQFVVNFFVSLVSFFLVYGIYGVFYDYHMRGSILQFLAAYLLVVVSIYSIGMMLASVSPNIKTANLLCCIVYFPMLFLSGATLPYEIMPKMMQRVTDLFPLTQGIKLLKATSLGISSDDVLLPVIVMITVAALCIVASIRFFRWE